MGLKFIAGFAETIWSQVVDWTFENAHTFLLFLIRTARLQFNEDCRVDPHDIYVIDFTRHEKVGEVFEDSWRLRSLSRDEQ